MLTVIVGAGASYDSIDLDFSPNAGLYLERRPPLAAELFSPRDVFGSAIDRYPEMRPIVGRVRRAVRSGGLLEAELAKLRDEAGEYPARHAQLLAVTCYLRDIIEEVTREWGHLAHGVTHYADLVDQIGQWSSLTGQTVAFISFNYDTLLDDALMNGFRTAIGNFASYRNSNFWLVKPHGSINWARRVKWDIEPAWVQGVAQGRSTWRGNLFNLAGQYETEFVFHTPDPSFQLGNVGAIPALAIPVLGKQTFECPSEQLDLLDEIVRDTTKVLTIGWRGVEDHFLEKWRNRNDHFDVLAVSGTRADSEDTLANLRYREFFNVDFEHSPNLRQAFPGGFGNLVASDELRRFLDRE